MSSETLITLMKFMTLGYPDTAVSLDLAVRLFLSFNSCSKNGG